MATESACLLVTDISGYTGYLAAVELDHAQAILADLMNTIIRALRPAFRLAKLEGDAAFMYAIAEKLDGSLLLDTIERCYFGFRRRRRDVRQMTSCECNACVRIPELNLKFVVHHGMILRQRVAGQDELLGADVILVHRLLKNDVIASTGIEAYALFSQQCVDAMDVDVSALGMRAYGEAYEHIGAVSVWVHDLGRRWQEEESRTRVMVDKHQAVYQLDTPSSAPPQLAWEFVTTPGRRITWQLGVTGVEVIATGNRRGVGATNHCMHVKARSSRRSSIGVLTTISLTAAPFRHRWGLSVFSRQLSSSRRPAGRSFISGLRRPRRSRSAPSWSRCCPGSRRQCGRAQPI